MLALGLAWALTVTEPAETGPVALSRLLDEIRADRGWREQIDLTGAPTGPPVGDAPAAAGPPAPAERLVVPPADNALADALGALADAVVAADAVVPIGGGRPVVGEAMAVLRRQIHAEIRIYQDRQTLVNQQLAAALRRLVAALDPTASGGPLAALWSAVGRLEARIEAIEATVAAGVGDDPAVRRIGAEVTALRGGVDALNHELEPIGHVRVAVADLAARLDALERGRAAG
jgi:hypothetical protein